jgi:hypothetical protein
MLGKRTAGQRGTRKISSYNTHPGRATNLDTALCALSMRNQWNVRYDVSRAIPRRSRVVSLLTTKSAGLDISPIGADNNGLLGVK